MGSGSGLDSTAGSGSTLTTTGLTTMGINSALGTATGEGKGEGERADSNPVNFRSARILGSLTSDFDSARRGLVIVFFFHSLFPATAKHLYIRIF